MTGELDPSYIRASLVITSDDLVPDEISGRLGCGPTRSGKRGEPNSAGGTRRVGSWVLESPMAPSAELNEQLRWILDPVPSSDSVWAPLRERHDVKLDCLLLHDGMMAFSLAADVLQRMAELKIPLWFTVDVLDEPEE